MAHSSHTAVQGDIESVAAMSPKDLTAMFEVISGSDAYRKEYEELEAKKSAADDQLRFMFSKKKTVVAERKQKHEQKVEAERHMRMQQELVRLPCRDSCMSAICCRLWGCSS